MTTSISKTGNYEKSVDSSKVEAKTLDRHADTQSGYEGFLLVICSTFKLCSKSYSTAVQYTAV